MDGCKDGISRTRTQRRDKILVCRHGKSLNVIAVHSSVKVVHRNADESFARQDDGLAHLGACVRAAVEGFWFTRAAGLFIHGCAKAGASLLVAGNSDSRVRLLCTCLTTWRRRTRPAHGHSQAHCIVACQVDLSKETTELIERGVVRHVARSRRNFQIKIDGVSVRIIHGRYVDVPDRLRRGDVWARSSEVAVQQVGRGKVEADTLSYAGAVGKRRRRRRIWRLWWWRCWRWP